MAGASVFLAMGLAACGGEGLPVPTERQIVGSWSNPGGDLVIFNEGGNGKISAGAQFQLSTLIEKSETEPECSFSWGIDQMAAGEGEWVSIVFAAGQCGPAPGEFGLHYHYEQKTGKLLLSPDVEYPESGETYSRETQPEPGY